jgi:hypothetical protein
VTQHSSSASPPFPSFCILALSSSMTYRWGARQD